MPTILIAQLWCGSDGMVADSTYSQTVGKNESLYFPIDAAENLTRHAGHSSYVRKSARRLFERQSATDTSEYAIRVSSNDTGY